MKRLFAGPYALVLLSLFLFQTPIQAQTAVRSEGTFRYDASREVKINGIVASVLTKNTPGMIMGSHLMLTTASGLVDTSLGAFGLRGKGALSVTAGKQVEVTGVMKTIRGRQVFLARTVSSGGKSYAIRNVHGIPVSPQARARASRKTAGEGL
jgi:hypothetical protein